MRAATSSSLVIVLGASLALTGCASGGDAGFCGPLLDDTETAATVFVVAVPGQFHRHDVEERLELMEKLDAPADLGDDLETWRTYLEAVVDKIDDDPAAALAAYNDDEDIEKAGSALFDYYTDVCMM